MKKNIFLKISLALALILIVMLPYSTTTSEALTYDLDGVTSSKLNVMEKASNKSKKVGTLKKGTKVTIYNRTKSGWSEIEFKSKKAYILSKYVKIVKSTMNTYKRDPMKIYTYDSRDVGIVTAKYIGDYNGKNKKLIRSKIWQETDQVNYEPSESLERETDGGLYQNGDKVLSYPIKVGNKGKISGDSYTIKSVNKTVKTPAGTFKNVVVVETWIYKYYFAKGVGIIRTDEFGNKVYELTKMRNRF